MTHSARDSIYQAIASIRLIDPHTHINPHAPASRTLADLLGYHYYTELAHSAGMCKSEIEEDGIEPQELVRRLVANLGPIENTSQYRWLVEICRKFFDFEFDRIDLSNWESLYDAAERKMASAEWSQIVLDKSNVESVFLTNDFDDDLAGFDTRTYIPCLRTDDLVFKLHQRDVRERLERSSGVSLDGSLSSLRNALRARFDHFAAAGARACAISLPPDFSPRMVNDGRASNALGAVLRHSESVDISHQAALAKTVFWMLAELCDEYSLPFDLMIGVNRGVYGNGVYQGQDLYDSRVSLIQYRELFNAFSDVTFPVSVLASVTNQELVSYSWIFPNVVTNGHWWYSNTPSFIHRDAAARLEAIPQTKQIGYYSDAYKLEFVWPKFDMYRQILANILAEHFVGMNGWSEEQAIELGRRVLRSNVEEIFLDGVAAPDASDAQNTDEAAVASSQALDTVIDQSVQVIDEPIEVVEEVSEGVDEPIEVSEEPVVVAEDPVSEDFADEPSDEIDWAAAASMAGAGAALAAGAIGVVEVNDSSVEDDAEFGESVAPQSNAELEGSSGANESRSEEAQTDDDIDLSMFDDDPALNSEATGEDSAELQNEEDEVAFESDRDAVGTETATHETEQMDALVPDSIDLDEHSDSVPDSGEAMIGSAVDVELDLDPLPNEDELKAVDVADVELGQSPGERAASEVESTDIDDEALDVGDLLSENESGVSEADSDDSTEPKISMLRGEESFIPDEDSLQLQPDPLTGELRFTPPSETEENDESMYAVDDSEESNEDSIAQSGNDVGFAEQLLEDGNDVLGQLGIGFTDEEESKDS